MAENFVQWKLFLLLWKTFIPDFEAVVGEFCWLVKFYIIVQDISKLWVVGWNLTFSNSLLCHTPWWYLILCLLCFVFLDFIKVFNGPRPCWTMLSFTGVWFQILFKNKITFLTFQTFSDCTSIIVSLASHARSTTVMTFIVWLILADSRVPIECLIH